MARERSPNREKAKQMYIKSAGSMKLVDIAAELNIKDSQIRKWKSQDKWDKELKGALPMTNGNVTNKKGGQPGNRNAAGNKGGSAPPGNKNAVTTGEFETLFFDTLNQDEKNLIQLIELDKEKLLLQEIQLLTVRERRMLKRIELLKESENEAQDIEVIVKETGEMFSKPPPGMTVVSFKTGFEKGNLTDLREYEGIIGQIQNIEDALTRVQARKQKAIETLHKFGYDDARLEIETMRLEMEILKQSGDGDAQQEDGFIEAMNVAAEDVWCDFNE